MKGSQMATEDVYAVALSAIQATAEAPTKEDAMLDAHNVLGGLDEVALRRVAVCLATELAWSRLGTAVGRSLPGRGAPAGVVEANWRPALQQWVDQLRLEVAWHSSPKGSNL